MWSVTENRKRGEGLLLNWKRKPRADTKVKLNPEMSARLQHQGCKVLPQCSSHQTLFCFLSPCLSYLLLFQDHCFLIFPAFQTAWQLLQRGVWMGFFWASTFPLLYLNGRRIAVASFWWFDRKEPFSQPGVVNLTRGLSSAGSQHKGVGRGAVVKNLVNDVLILHLYQLF